MATLTPNLGLIDPDLRERGWGLMRDANAVLLDGLTPLGGLFVAPAESPSASLNVRVTTGGYQKADGTVGSYAGTASQVVTASATTLLWLTDAGVLTLGTAWPATPHIRLASVVAGTASITSVADARVAYQTLAAPPGGGAPVGASYVVLGTDPTLTAERVLTGTANQVIITDGGANNPVTLSAPQNLHSAAVPTFAGLIVPVAAKTVAYTITDADNVILADATGGAFAVTLPTAVGRAGRKFTVKRTNGGANAVTVATTSGQTIDGATTQAIGTQYQSISCISDGTNWFII